MIGGSPTAEWRERLEHIVTRAQAEAGGLTERQLKWTPSDGGWSIGQVLDHLSETNERYLGVIRSSLESPRNARNARAAWKPSFMGSLLARALLSPRKVRAPKTFMPAAAVGAKPVERFNSSVRALASELERAAEVDLRRTRVRSPASRLVRLNLGDAFHVQVLHAERHLHQIRRIREHTDFPV